MNKSIGLVLTVVLTTTIVSAGNKKPEKKSTAQVYHEERLKKSPLAKMGMITNAYPDGQCMREAAASEYALERYKRERTWERSSDAFQASAQHGKCMTDMLLEHARDNARSYNYAASAYNEMLGTMQQIGESISEENAAQTRLLAETEACGKEPLEVGVRGHLCARQEQTWRCAKRLLVERGQALVADEKGNRLRIVMGAETRTRAEMYECYLNEVGKNFPVQMPPGVVTKTETATKPPKAKIPKKGKSLKKAERGLAKPKK